jgi:hypothetical protein
MFFICLELAFKLAELALSGKNRGKTVLKIQKMVDSLVYVLIEMNLVDYVFYCTYNIHQAGHNTEHAKQSFFSGKNISLGVSMAILARITLMQVSIFSNSFNLRSNHSPKSTNFKSNEQLPSDPLPTESSMLKPFQEKEHTNVGTEEAKIERCNLNYDRITENLDLSGGEELVPWQACFLYSMFNIKLFVTCVLLTTMQNYGVLMAILIFLMYGFTILKLLYFLVDGTLKFKSKISIVSFILTEIFILVFVASSFLLTPFRFSAKFDKNG